MVIERLGSPEKFVRVSEAVSGQPDPPARPCIPSKPACARAPACLLADALLTPLRHFSPLTHRLRSFATPLKPLSPALKAFYVADEP
jgi:hypothetical protein